MLSNKLLEVDKGFFYEGSQLAANKVESEALTKLKVFVDVPDNNCQECKVVG
jgi:hypothetical protein